MKVKLYEPFMKWYHGGTIWLCSDPHFQKDTEMEEFFKWPTAEERLAKINECVTKNDTFVCLGDVGDRLDLISKIKCDYKVLITGNHDKGNINYKMVKDFPIVYVDTYEEAKKVIKTRTYIGGTTRNPHEYKIPEKWIDLRINVEDDGNNGLYYEVVADNHLFDEIYDGPLFINSKIVLSHERCELPFVLNIHGHEHCGVYAIEKQYVMEDGTHTSYLINLASDVVGFVPMRLDKIIEQFPLNRIKSIHDIAIETATGGKRYDNV